MENPKQKKLVSEKKRAIRANVGSVGGLLAWMVC